MSEGGLWLPVGFLDEYQHTAKMALKPKARGVRGLVGEPFPTRTTSRIPSLLSITKKGFVTWRTMLRKSVPVIGYESAVHRPLGSHRR